MKCSLAASTARERSSAETHVPQIECSSVGTDGDKPRPYWYALRDAGASATLHRARTIVFARPRL